MAIPVQPLAYEVDKKTFQAIKELKERHIDIRRDKTRMHFAISERIYECKTTKRLEKEFPEAYKTMLEIEKAKSDKIKLMFYEYEK